MRTKSFFIGLCCLFVVMIVLAMSTRSQKAEEPLKFEIIEIGTGGSPQWSPDGTKLAFVYKGNICVANSDGKGEIRKVYVPQDRLWTFNWMNDSSFVVSEKKDWTEPKKGRVEKFTIGTVGMNRQMQVTSEVTLPGYPDGMDFTYLGAPIVLKDGTVGYYEFHHTAGGETKIFKIVKAGKLQSEEAKKQLYALTIPYGWGMIWVESVDGTFREKVSKGDTTWLFPELSPDGKKLFAKNHQAEIIVMDLQGNILANLGRGGCVSWSPDSKRIVFCIQEDSEFDIVASELYIINADGTGKLQITNTPNEIETEPVWSPDGTKIACGSHSSSKIFVIRLIQN
jgi:Tol biopolymer transport system component